MNFTNTIELSKQELDTISWYDENAQSWMQTHEDPEYWIVEHNRFQAYLPNGRVLEIGCGFGRDATILLPRYTYFGIDVSAGLLKLARSRFPKEVFLKMDCYNLKFPDDYFNGFWAAATLIHIPKSRLHTVLSNLRYCLKSNGVGFISLKKGDNEQELAEEQNGTPARYFVYYQQGEFSDLVEKAGFSVLEHYEHPTVDVTWLNFFIQKKP